MVVVHHFAGFVYVFKHFAVASVLQCFTSMFCSPSIAKNVQKSNCSTATCKNVAKFLHYSRCFCIANHAHTLERALKLGIDIAEF